MRGLRGCWRCHAGTAQQRRVRAWHSMGCHSTPNAIENHSQLEHLDLSKPANSRRNNANWTYGVAKSLKSLNALVTIITIIRFRPHLRDIVASWQPGGVGRDPPGGGCGGGRVYIEKHTHACRKIFGFDSPALWPHSVRKCACAAATVTCTTVDL